MPQIPLYAEREADADLANETWMEQRKEKLMEDGLTEEEAEDKVREEMGLK